MDDFIEAVIGRLEGERVNARDLNDLWTEVREERREPERTASRKLEAILGYDPDEAPDGLVEALRKIESSCGAGAVDEVAAATKDDAPRQLAELWNDVRPKAINAQVADTVELRKRIRKETSRLPLPWQRATRAAAIARRTWQLGSGPVSTHVLAQLCDVPEAVLSASDASADAPFSSGFRNGKADRFAVFLNKKYPAGRRFALARLIGDHLVVTGDRLLPATDARTARQKFQRAFAQEFLCPFADLSDFLGTDDPTDEQIEAAAEQFEVSPLMIKTTLVNKGLVERESLDDESSRPAHLSS